jgi:uncharacterized protein (DUF1778 family)
MTAKSKRGRPARAGEPSKVVVSIRLTETEARTLRAAARANGGQDLPEFLRDLAVTEAAELLEK